MPGRMWGRVCTLHKYYIYIYIYIFFYLFIRFVCLFRLADLLVKDHGGSLKQPSALALHRL